MLAADPFDGFTHHGGGSCIDETVGEVANGRVCGDAGGRVAAAAFDAEQQLAKREFLLLLLACLSRELAGGTNGFFDGFQRAPFLLNAKGDDRTFSHGLNFLTQNLVRYRFAAEADDNDTVDIWVCRKACEHFL